MPEVRYLTEREVSEMTGYAVQTLRNDRYRCRGIPYIKNGYSIRYSSSDVIAYMERHKVTTEDK
jgi:predicted DNA-binding transcriptional regulator AlpA